MPNLVPALLPLTLARTFLLIFVSFAVPLPGISAVHYYTQYQAERVTPEASETVNVTPGLPCGAHRHRLGDDRPDRIGQAAGGLAFGSWDDS